MGKISFTIFLVFGVGGTAIMFMLHALFSKYGMNPLAFIMCVVPLIITLPILVFDDDDYEGR